MGTNNQINTQKPIAVTDGGTGDASFTAYSVLCGGTTGTAPLQNVSGLGTSGYVLTSNGSSMLPTWQAVGTNNASINIQFFTISGTYTPTSGMVYCIIEVVGGGGGSGGCPTTGSGTVAAAGGGGGGGYSRGIYSASTIGASQTVTIGAGGTAGTGSSGGGTGGTTSVGSLLSATGGGGGSLGNVGSATSAGNGSGGTGSGGIVNITGGSGDWGWGSCIGEITMGGRGGGSVYGFGGGSVPQATTNNASGSTGTGFGGGASGANNGISDPPKAGSAGSAGVVIVTEFIAG